MVKLLVNSQYGIKEILSEKFITNTSCSSSIWEKFFDVKLIRTLNYQWNKNKGNIDLDHKFH